MEFPKKLRMAMLMNELPGREAQLRMAHITRSRYVEAPPEARVAAVMLTLFPKEENWNLLLIKRKTVHGDRHSGQIGFPGGKFEPEDGTLIQTALRETEEEVGIARREINVLGPLTDLYIPVSNFVVHPYVGVLDRQPAYRLQESEVSKVVEKPIRHFLDPTARKITDIRVGEGLSLKNVPYFDLEGEVLWGATAMILSEFLEIIKSNFSGDSSAF